LEVTKFLESVLKTDGELLIDCKDFLALLGSTIRTLLINVLFESRMIISNLQLVLLHHLQLIGKVPHSLSEVLLVSDPVTVHTLKSISGDFLLGSSSFEFNLGIRFSCED